MQSNGYNLSSAQQIVDNALLMASLSIRAQLLSFLPTLYRMDINENIVIKEEEHMMGFVICV